MYGLNELLERRLHWTWGMCKNNVIQGRIYWNDGSSKSKLYSLHGVPKTVRFWDLRFFLLEYYEEVLTKLDPHKFDPGVLEAKLNDPITWILLPCPLFYHPSQWQTFYGTPYRKNKPRIFLASRSLVDCYHQLYNDQ